MAEKPVESRLTAIRQWLDTRHVGQAFQPVIRFSDLRTFTGKDLQAVAFHKRALPHWELEGSTYFLTFRVHKDLGKILDDENLALLVEEVLWLGYRERFLLDAYVIMPDHVHLLLAPLDAWSLPRILQGIKGFSARQVNRYLARKGTFWQTESFDHLIRNEEDWLDKFTYIHNNPVSAGLVSEPQDYPFSSLVTIHSQGRDVRDLGQEW